MSSREKILAAVKQNQPAPMPLPEVVHFDQPFSDLREKFITVLESIGGKVFPAKNVADIITVLKGRFVNEPRIISVLKDFEPFASYYNIHESPHLLENVDLAIIPAQFGVAENGAVWVTDELLPARVLPFICQHLVAVVNSKDLVATMHEAYDFYR
jgi:L-lactate dehydrogenase complex protein LldG